MEDLRESTTIYGIMGITLLLISIALMYYFYYRGLRKRECSVMGSLYGELNGKIQSINSTETFQYALNDYYIKSAYNCCNGGSYKNDYVDTCILKYLLKQGVRGLDFEIFSIDDQPVVASSTSESYFVKETFNYIPFSTVLTLIRDYAFATATAPNAQDPIILHLRIKSNHMPMYKNFATMLEQYNSMLLGKEYDSENYGHNFGQVKLRDLMGKVAIIVERSNTTFLECPEFYKFINMTSNSVFMRALSFYDIQNTPDMEELIEFNKQNMTIGMPDKGSNPSNPSSVVMREMGVQMLAMRYQTVDAELEENNLFFDNHGSAFVLKPEALRYKPVTVPLPKEQTPAVSYATKTVESDYYKFKI